MNGRVIVYGDLHGCLNELILLREQIEPKESDIEFSLGDVINKGPYSKELLKYMMREGINSILGNHEEKLLRYRFHEMTSKKRNPIDLSDAQQDVYDLLDDEIFCFFESLPHFVRLGNLTLLHGGTTNRLSLDSLSKKEQQLLLHIRWLDKNEHFVSLEETKYKSDHFWADVYDGHDGFIVFGHQPFRKPKITRNAVGIDTGCVYGNKLTAAIFYHTDGVVEDTKYELIQIDAQDSYEQKANLL